MTVNAEERLQVLKMIEDGKVTPEEGTRLMSALSTDAGSQRSSGPAARWVRIRITEAGAPSPTVNINLPASLLNLVGRFGNNFVKDHDIDLEAVLDEIRRGASGPLVHVEDEDGTRVEITVE